VFCRWNYVFRFWWLSCSRPWRQLLAHSTQCARAKRTKRYGRTSHVSESHCIQSRVSKLIYVQCTVRFKRLVCFGCNRDTYDPSESTCTTVANGHFERFWFEEDKHEFSSFFFYLIFINRIWFRRSYFRLWKRTFALFDFVRV